MKRVEQPQDRTPKLNHMEQPINQLLACELISTLTLQAMSLISS